MHARLDSLDHFNLLGVERDASPEETKARYVALARKWHADAYAGLDLGSYRDMLDSIFKRIAEAHSVLSNPESRAEYITYLDRQRAGLSTDVESILRGESKVDEGIAELSRKRWANAEAAFDEAIALNPDDPLTWTHRAWARYRKDGGSASAAQRARSELERAFKTQENLPEAYRYLGTIAFEHDQLDDAVRWLERCLRWATKDVDATRLIRLARSRKEKRSAASAGMSGLWSRLFGKK